MAQITVLRRISLLAWPGSALWPDQGGVCWWRWWGNTKWHSLCLPRGLSVSWGPNRKGQMVAQSTVRGAVKGKSRKMTQGSLAQGLGIWGEILAILVLTLKLPLCPDYLEVFHIYDLRESLKQPCRKAPYLTAWRVSPVTGLEYLTLSPMAITNRSGVWSPAT